MFIDKEKGVKELQTCFQAMTNILVNERDEEMAKKNLKF